MFWRWSQRKARAAGRKLQELRLEPRPNILPLSRLNSLSTLSTFTAGSAQVQLYLYPDMLALLT